jgi:hypothetical protein
MPTLSQQNKALGAYNNAITGGWAGGGPAGSSPLWGVYNDTLDRYGIGNGGATGAGSSGYPAGIGYNPGGSVVLGGTGNSGSPINFNLNPSPQAGAGTFGAVPGAIGAPPSLWDETMANVPGIAGLTGQTSNLIGSQMNGDLSASTIGNLTDAAAARGVQLGQGGSTGLTNEILLKTLGLTHEQLQQQGQSNYLNFLGATSSLQQKPELLAEIASRNATMAAAPNPELASKYLMGLSSGSGSGGRGGGSNLLNSLLRGMGGGGSGGGGGYYGGNGFSGPTGTNLLAGVDPSLYTFNYNSGAPSPRDTSGGFSGYNQVDNLSDVAPYDVGNYDYQSYDDLWTD